MTAAQAKLIIAETFVINDADELIDFHLPFDTLPTATPASIDGRT